MTHLPLPNPINRINQHHDIQNQTVSNPQKQNHLSYCENHKGTAKTYLLCEGETSRAHEDVAQRIDDRIAFVAERHRRFAVSADDEIRILNHFPQRLDDDGEREPPNGC